MTTTLSIKESNQIFLDYLSKDKPFFIGRLSDEITNMSLNYMVHGVVNQRLKHISKTNAGIYYKDDTKDDDAIIYCKFYISSLKNITALASFPSLYVNSQNFTIKKFNLKKHQIFHNRVLEPFYLLNENKDEIIWTHRLKDKKVLIISPFVDTFKSQIEKGFNFYGKDDERRIWNKDQQFVFYKAYVSLAHNKPHKNWFETYLTMCQDIKQLDFDIALLSCGGYGMLLCDFIFSKMNKSSIYIGGGLQLLFGVYGNRWLNHNIISGLIRENSDWCRPSNEEKPKNCETVEGGCYW